MRFNQHQVQGWPDSVVMGAFVFTTMALLPQPQYAQQHLQRLCVHAQAVLGVVPDVQLLQSELEHYYPQTGLLRLMVSLQGIGSVLRPLQATPRHSVGLPYCDGAQVGVWPQYKTGQYLPYQLALAKARAAGAFEAAVCQDQHVVDGARSSLLLQTSEGWLLPEGGLEGVVRAQVVAWLQAQGQQVHRRWVAISEAPLAGASKATPGVAISEAPLAGASKATPGVALEGLNTTKVWYCGSGIGVVASHAPQNLLEQTILSTFALKQ